MIVRSVLYWSFSVLRTAENDGEFVWFKQCFFLNFLMRWREIYATMRQCSASAEGFFEDSFLRTLRAQGSDLEVD